MNTHIVFSTNFKFNYNQLNQGFFSDTLFTILFLFLLIGGHWPPRATLILPLLRMNPAKMPISSFFFLYQLLRREFESFLFGLVLFDRKHSLLKHLYLFSFVFRKRLLLFTTLLHHQLCISLIFSVILFT